MIVADTQHSYQIMLTITKVVKDDDDDDDKCKFVLSVEEHNTGKIVGVVLGAVASVILVLGLVIMVACKKCYSQEG